MTRPYIVRGPMREPLRHHPADDRIAYSTVAEVARRLRVSTMSVYRLVHSGRLAAVRVGRAYRIPLADVERYLNQRFMDTG